MCACCSSCMHSNTNMLTRTRTRTRTHCALTCASRAFSLSLCVCVLVGVGVRKQAPQQLRLTRTYTNKELQTPTESNNVWILGMSPSEDGRTILLADNSNGSVKGLDVAAGTVCSLYKETDGWQVGNACLLTHTEGTSLLVTEMNKSNEYTKRVVVADRSGAADIFTRTYDITWKDDTYVRVWRGWMRASHPPPTRTHPPLPGPPRPSLPSLSSALSHLDTTYMTPYCNSHKLLLTCPAHPGLHSIR